MENYQPNGGLINGDGKSYTVIKHLRCFCSTTNYNIFSAIEALRHSKRSLQICQLGYLFQCVIRVALSDLTCMFLG